MSVRSFDVGFVSRDESLVRFYQSVLALTPLEPRRFPRLTVHRLSCGPGVLKVTVPEATPDDPVPSADFLDRVGLRYVTVWVDDLDGVTARWAKEGGVVKLAPTPIRPGVRTALLIDLDGNTVEAMEEAPHAAGK